MVSKAQTLSDTGRRNGGAFLFCHENDVALVAILSRTVNIGLAHFSTMKFANVEHSDKTKFCEKKSLNDRKYFLSIL